MVEEPGDGSVESDAGQTRRTFLRGLVAAGFAVPVVQTFGQSFASALPTGTTTFARPQIGSVRPIKGPVSGGTEITINGFNFVPDFSVRIEQGDFATVIDVASAWFVSPTEIHAITPGVPIAGPWSVVVATPGGVSPVTQHSTFTFFGPHGQTTPRPTTPRPTTTIK